MAPYRPGFDLFLDFGDWREDELHEWLHHKRVEVKSETRSGEYGTIFVEIARSHGALSGLSVTEADIWAIETAPRRWSLLETDALRSMTRYRMEQHGTSFGGPDRESIGVRVPRQWLLG